MVRNNARLGSPFFDVTANGLRKGIIPSAAIACSKRGAPVNYNNMSELIVLASTCHVSLQ